MKNFRLIIIFIFALTAINLIGCMSSNEPATGGACGIVLDSNGKALSGATITAGGSTAVSDYYGKWTLESLEPQITDFVASKENYQSQTKTYEVQSGIILENITFQLPSDGEIFDIVISEVTSTKANISFQTKYEATTKIAYGSNAHMDKVINSSSAHKYSHQFQLTGLTPATTYVFQCLGTDKYNRSLSSAVKTFTTSVSSRGEPPTGLSIAKVSGNSAFSLSWNADATADLAGYNIYRSTSINGVFEKINVGVVKQASYVDMGVTVGEKYCYRVTRVAGSGDESSPSSTVSMVMPGVINSNVVWNSQGSPYEVSGDLIIAQGASLIIAKGTEVRIARGDRWDPDGADTDLIDITVYGTLLIQGTDGEPVGMTSSEIIPQSGDWEGIIFKDSADLKASSLKSLNIQFAKNGIFGEEGLPEIISCKFNNCSENAIYSEKAVQDINISNCEIVTCKSGVFITNSNKVNLKDNTFSNCSYAIKALENNQNEIIGNKIKKNINTAIEVLGKNTSSIVSRNTIGWGTGGTGILCHGADEIRRNTVQANICIRIDESADSTVRSNLMIADKDKNGMGLQYISSNTSSSNLLIQNNAVWNQNNNVLKYGNTNNKALTSVTGDLSFTSTTGPAFQSGNPFADNIDDFIYIPNPGSVLKKAGYDSMEDIGAEDVPNQ